MTSTTFAGSRSLSHGILGNEPEKVRAGEEAVERRTDAVAQPRTGRLETRARQIAVVVEQTLQARDVAHVDGGDRLAEQRVDVGVLRHGAKLPRPAPNHASTTTPFDIQIEDRVLHWCV